MNPRKQPFQHDLHHPRSRSFSFWPASPELLHRSRVTSDSLAQIRKRPNLQVAIGQDGVVAEIGVDAEIRTRPISDVMLFPDFRTLTMPNDLIDTGNRLELRP